MSEYALDEYDQKAFDLILPAGRKGVRSEPKDLPCATSTAGTRSGRSCCWPAG